MNLIEEYGSYEKASKACDKEIKDGGYPHDLVAELLEHRRANNIFEKGDIVKAKDHQFGFDELYKIEDFFADGNGVNLAVLDDGDCYPISFLEHATDAEIKAGHGL